MDSILKPCSLWPYRCSMLRPCVNAIDVTPIDLCPNLPSIFKIYVLAVQTFGKLLLRMCPPKVFLCYILLNYLYFLAASLLCFR